MLHWRLLRQAGSFLFLYYDLYQPPDGHWLPQQSPELELELELERNSTSTSSSGGETVPGDWVLLLEKVVGLGLL